MFLEYCVEILKNVYKPIKMEEMGNKQKDPHLNPFLISDNNLEAGFLRLISIFLVNFEQILRLI